MHVALTDQLEKMVKAKVARHDNHASEVIRGAAPSLRALTITKPCLARLTTPQFLLALTQYRRVTPH
jgi:hypothetical protein